MTGCEVEVFGRTWCLGVAGSFVLTRLSGNLRSSGKFSDQRREVGILRDQYGSRRKVKIRELKSGRDIATHERVTDRIFNVRGEMRARRDRSLPRTIGSKFASIMATCRIDDLDREWVSSVEMPCLIGRQPMEGRKRFAGEQKQDRRQRTACAAARSRHSIGAPKRLAKITAFGMRRKPQFGDETLGLRVHLA